MTNAPTPQRAEPAPHAPEWLVVVGASAGGLDALQRFFRHLRRPSHAAFVVVQHLAPDHRSLMTELLSPHCDLSVQEASDGQTLRTDHVYLMPAGVVMTAHEGKIHFEPRPPQGISLPINHLLHGLDAEAASRTIAVVLSGSGSDGANGVQHLHGLGGFVLVQSPDTAQFDSMPKSAMAATQADAVCAPEELADTTMAITQGRADRFKDEGLVYAPSARNALQRIFSLLLDRFGIDFGQYKLPTVMRRVERRVQACMVAALPAYADLVEQSSAEAEHLRQELLIPVTSFFRDPTAFDALALALDELLTQLPANQPLRLWSAGCATGEEAYSLAIMALEACARAGREVPIKVFGTDVDPLVLDVATAGIYPATMAASLSAPRLAAYFTVDDAHLTVRPEVRRLVLFARHNLLEDPPFTRMDLVACRNTLIYLQAQAQERVLRRLQFALRARGVLFLGSSESLGRLQADFTLLHEGARLHQLLRPGLIDLGQTRPALRAMAPERTRSTEAITPPDASRLMVELANRTLLQECMPLSLLLSPQRVLLHSWGPVDRFLRLSDGEPRLDILSLLPERLHTVVRHAFNTALQHHRASLPPAVLDVHGQSLCLRVSARLLSLSQSGAQAVLVQIEEQPVPAPVGDTHPTLDLNHQERRRLTELEHELADTRLSLQATIADHEATNEALQTTNEELMSANEELQSTNEELQSVNEELYTVNAEFNAKIEALSQLNADIEGMAQATGIATLFVDQQLNLLRFTPEAAHLFRFRPSDLGRPITDFNNPMEYPGFIADLRQVFDTGAVIEREVTLVPNGLFTVRMVACGDARGSKRAVISLTDISRTREAQRLQAIIDAMSAHVAVLDAHGTIVLVNRAWLDFAQDNGGTRAVGIGTNYLAVLARASTPDALDVLRGIQSVLNQQAEHYEVTYPCHSPTTQRWFAMSANACPGLGGAVVAHYNISSWCAPSTAPEPICAPA